MAGKIDQSHPLTDDYPFHFDLYKASRRSSPPGSKYPFTSPDVHTQLLLKISSDFYLLPFFVSERTDNMN